MRVLHGQFLKIINFVRGNCLLIAAIGGDPGFPYYYRRFATRRLPARVPDTQDLPDIPPVDEGLVLFILVFISGFFWYLWYRYPTHLARQAPVPVSPPQKPEVGDTLCDTVGGLVDMQESITACPPLPCGYAGDYFLPLMAFGFMQLCLFYIILYWPLIKRECWGYLR